MLNELAAAPEARGETGRPPSLDLRPDSTALFLDCDGTLAAIVDRPMDARVPPATLATVDRLHRLYGGAVAIISGRSLADIDRLFAPHLFAAAGTHGMERRGPGGLHLPQVDRAELAAVAIQLDEFAQRHDGLLVERKSSAVALHYRLRPDLEAETLDFAQALAAAHPPVRLQLGKAVAELGFGDKTKADAIREFMVEEPFAGRVPVFAGDDLTDEDGFAAVAAMGGHAIKVGPGATAAGFRLEDPVAVARWLGALALAWEENSTTSREARSAGRGG